MKPASTPTRFINWYLRLMLYWVAFQVGVSAFLIIVVKTPSKIVMQLFGVWLLPTLFAAPLICGSWLLVHRPKLRALVFSLAIFVFSAFDLLATSYSGLKLGMMGSEFAKDMLIAGIGLVPFCTVVAYFAVVRRLKNSGQWPTIESITTPAQGASHDLPASSR